MEWIFKMRHYLLLSFALFLWAPVSVLAQEGFLPGSFYSKWNTDTNKKLTHAEFYEGLSGTDLFRSWDASRNFKLERQEFLNGMEKMHPSLTASASEVPETDHHSSQLPVVYFPENGHFSRQVRNENLFEQADLNRDGNLNKAEFYTHIFRAFDKDENGFLSPAECAEPALERWFVH